MPQVTFEKIELQKTYSRQLLAALWGYAGFEALARGIVTPAKDNRIILFVTEKKRDQDTQYVDYLSDGILYWDGPNDHFGEERLLNAHLTGDEIHLFYRALHNADFTYYGLVVLQSSDLQTDQPSKFRFQLEQLL